jgi:hypothetical protein
VEAYGTIYMVESLFGTELRQKAMEIARERVEMRKAAQKMGHFDFHRLRSRQKECKQGAFKMTRDLPS